MVAEWELIDSAESLRTEFNVLAPDRDKSSDGSIGDSDHASSSSDHNPDETGATPFEDADNINEVHAIDVTAKLNKPGWTMQKAVDIIVDRHANGRDNRLQNVIYNGYIWSASWEWTKRKYTGKNQHKLHAHFGFKYTTAQERNTSSWGLLEEGRMYVNLPRKGDSGESVRYWQYLMSRIKSLYPKENIPNITVDGQYGPATAGLVKKLWEILGGEGTFDGSYISGWLGMKMQEAFAYYSVKAKIPAGDVTPAPISDAKMKEYVDLWLSTKLPEDLGIKIENIEGRLFLR